MLNHEGLDKNFRFMVLEVTRQLESTFRAIATPSRQLIRKIVSSDHYIDTLKGLIEKKCISFFRHTDTLDKQSADLARAISVVATNLEKIADYCVNIVRHIKQLSDPAFISRFQCKRYYTEVSQALGLIPDAILLRDTSRCLTICRTEQQLDQYYQSDVTRIKDELRQGENTDDLVTCMYIFHYLERMGDSLLNIGEAILAAITGEKLKMHQYRALEETLGIDSLEQLPGDYSIEFKWETRSGAQIGKIEDEHSDQEAIFKAGQPDKLIRERDNIERWNQIVPGLPPRVLEFRENERNAALLLEFLEGYTFQEMVFNAESAQLSKALLKIQETLEQVWNATRRDEPVNGEFLGQTLRRIDDVFRVHPHFRDLGHQVGSLTMNAFEDLLRNVKPIGDELEAPFRVLIHGDFNADNVIYNHHEDKVHFIDLYRSAEMDYVQDISVFMVSNFRMPIFEAKTRERLNDVIVEFYHFAHDYAARHNDTTFDARLALGLARSFITSTRFELDEDFAKTMYLRSIYLLEKILSHRDRNWERFRLEEETLVY